MLQRRTVCVNDCGMIHAAPLRAMWDNSSTGHGEDRTVNACNENEFCFCLSNAMHNIGQSIKSPERPSVRPCVRPTFEAPYLHNGAG